MKQNEDKCNEEFRKQWDKEIKEGLISIDFSELDSADENNINK